MIQAARDELCGLPGKSAFQMEMEEMAARERELSQQRNA